MTKEQAQNLKRGDKIRLTETLTVLDPCCNGNEDILADTPSGHLVFVEPHEAQLAETAPKYDPCRPFKAGDIVTPSPVKGRWFGAAWEGHREIRFTVTKDEDEEGTMWVQEDDSSTPIWVLAAFFQLISPVEELEPYEVEEFKETIQVRERNTSITLATFDKECHPHAKEAAEAECARLNAAYRKEQNNG